MNSCPSTPTYQPHPHYTPPPLALAAPLTYHPMHSHSHQHVHRAIQFAPGIIDNGGSPQHQQPQQQKHSSYAQHFPASPPPAVPNKLDLDDGSPVTMEEDEEDYNNPEFVFRLSKKLMQHCTDSFQHKVRQKKIEKEYLCSFSLTFCLSLFSSSLPF